MRCLLTTYIRSRTWAFQGTHHGKPKIQDGGDPPLWILMPKCQKMRFSQKLSNLELWSLLQKMVVKIKIILFM